MFVNRNQPFKNLHLSTSVSVSSYTLWKKTMHNNLSYHIFLDYITEFSKKQYTITLEPKHIRSAISTDQYQTFDRKLGVQEKIIDCCISYCLKEVNR